MWSGPNCLVWTRRTTSRSPSTARILTIRAERRQQDNGPCRSEFRYGSLARAVRLPARVDAADVTARYGKGVLEVSVPVREVGPEGIRIPVQNADAVPGQPPDQAG